MTNTEYQKQRIRGPIPAKSLRFVYGIPEGQKVRVEMPGEGAVKTEGTGKVCFDGVVVQNFPWNMTIYRPGKKEMWTNREREGYIVNLDYAGIHCGRFKIQLL